MHAPRTAATIHRRASGRTSRITTHCNPATRMPKTAVTGRRKTVNATRNASSSGIPAADIKPRCRPSESRAVSGASAGKGNPARIQIALAASKCARLITCHLPFCAGNCRQSRHALSTSGSAHASGHLHHGGRSYHVRIFEDLLTQYSIFSLMVEFRESTQVPDLGSVHGSDLVRPAVLLVRTSTPISHTFRASIVAQLISFSYRVH